MRKVVTIVICLAASNVTMFAQDIIILKNGNDIEAVVQEVGIEEVKYKRFNNQNGPNYLLRKSEIFMIRYENGSKDVFTEVTAPAEGQQPTTVNQQISPNHSSANSQQQLPIMKYTFGNQISPYGSEKSPFLAGFLSFLIPGVGQFYNGDVGGGFVYLGCNIVCNSVWMSEISTDYWGGTYVENETTFSIGLVSALIVNVTSILDAYKGAKKVNIARGYRIGDNAYLKIQPAVIQQNNLLANKEFAYGMNFSINF